MGLDMYAFRIRRISGEQLTQADLEAEEKPEGVTTEEIHYWRKHHDLHGLMEQLYRKQGGTAESFNVVPLLLTTEDLDLIEKATKEGTLPETSGFFFGSGNTEHYKDDTLEFVNEARATIKEGWQVYYTSWW